METIALTYDRYWVRPSSGETSEKFINRIKKCYNDGNRFL